MAKILSIISLLAAFSSFSLEDSETFYLLKNLDLSEISDADRELLDTSLTQYHASNNDTIQLDLLEHIVENCWDENIWPKYNSFMKERAQFLLNTQYSKSENWFKKVAKILAIAINNEGYLEYYYGNIEGALKSYQNSMTLKEQIGDTLGVSECLNNIGGIYFSQGDYDQALSYFKQSLAIKLKGSSPLSIATSYNNIGSVYNILENTDSAEFYYLKAMRIYNEEESEIDLGLAFHNLGSIYAKKEDESIARLYLLKSVQHNEKTGHLKLVSNSYNNLSKMYFKLNDIHQSEEYAKRSLEYANKIGYPSEIQDASEMLLKIYRKKGNFKQALDMYDLFVTMKDSVKNAQIRQDIENQQLQYQHQKKIYSDSLKYAEQDKINRAKISEQNAEIKRDRLLNWILVSSVVFLLIISVLIFVALSHKRKANIEIGLQKQEVEKQRDLVEEQHQITEQQRRVLESQHQEILDSINYAKRLQEAILPPEKSRLAHLPNSFIFYRPKDIVAGDFYWIEKIDDTIFFATADCTGHGVPGAFVSLVCSNALNNALLELGNVHPSILLDKVTDLVIRSFENSSHQIKDGMDISLCALDTKTNKLQYSGAYNPLWIISKKDEIYPLAKAHKNEEARVALFEIKATKQPVGKYTFQKAFEAHEIQLEKGETIYLLSDGYADQFGGKKGKKFKYKQLKNLLIAIHHYDMTEQKRMLNEAFEQWKGELEQIDDVCIMGVRI